MVIKMRYINQPDIDKKYFYVDYLEREIGIIKIVADSSAIINVSLQKEKNQIRENRFTEEAKKQLASYFAGKLTNFDLPINPEGTDFQKAVWDELLKIPYGQLLSYSNIAEKIKNPKAVRAVGNAVGRNPILIIIPCHRIIRSEGELGGFSAGIEVKKKLHRIEGINLKR